MKILTLLLFFSVITFAQTSNKKVVKAFRTDERILLDGRLNETLWKNQPITDFLQRDPDEGKQSTQKTEVIVGYDNENLYVGARLFDTAPDSIIGRLARKDNFEESDFFGVVFDSYYDKRTGFFFVGNPVGSYLDGTFLNDDWSDNSWNGIWEYKYLITDSGWNIEMKIPFSQLRFNESEEMVWGINFLRRIQRLNEEAYFVLVPKKESGFISKMADLVGLKGIKQKQRIEVLPYFGYKEQYLIHEKDDPFYSSKRYSPTMGADFKIGVGSNLTIDGTINPDFGQVEVDPAVVNLSAFETYFEEKRPFFIEGNEIFSFGQGGSNNNWNFNFSSPQLLYSRRIGKYPKGYSTHEGFVDIPSSTRILGAGKLSGKLQNGWSLGVLSGVTERTYAVTDSGGRRFNDEIEPLTFYSVGRVIKEFNEGSQSLGLMTTFTQRDLQTSNLKDINSRNALVIGVDGYTFLDKDKEYVLTSYVTGSYLSGSKEFFQRLQNSSAHYFQRPENEFVNLDSMRTNLSGWMFRTTVNKQKGNFYFNYAIGASSPSLNLNDLGFQFRNNVINSHLVLGYKWYESDGLFRNKNVFGAYFRSYSFEGLKTGEGFFLFSNLNFVNYYGLSLNLFYSPKSYGINLTRGGPAVLTTDYLTFSINGYTDSRKPLNFYYGFNSESGVNGSSYNGGYVSMNWKISSALSVNFSPNLDLSTEKLQWIGAQNDSKAIETFGKRYIFGTLTQKTFSANLRINWAFTPELSLQFYMQQLYSVGVYSEFKELGKPKSDYFINYGTEGTSIRFDPDLNEYTITPGNRGNDFTLSNPDFNFKFTKVNLVLRWEYNPGSVFYFVWARDQANMDNPGDLSLKRDIRDLWNSEANDIFMIKFTYWLDI